MVIALRGAEKGCNGITTIRNPSDVLIIRQNKLSFACYDGQEDNSWSVEIVTYFIGSHLAEGDQRNL